MYLSVIASKDNIGQKTGRGFDGVRVRTFEDKFESRIRNFKLGWILDAGYSILVAGYWILEDRLISPKTLSHVVYTLIWIQRGVLKAVDPFVGERKRERQREPFRHHIDRGLVKQKRARLKRHDQGINLIKQFLLFCKVCLIKGLTDEPGDVGMLKCAGFRAYGAVRRPH